MRRAWLSVALLAASCVAAHAKSDPAEIMARLDKALAGEACTADSAAVDMRGGTASGSPLLQRMTGFAKASGVTGGLGKPVLTVTDASDVDPKSGAKPAEGSLRALVATARRDGAWIVFSPALGPKPRIDLAAPLRLPSNVTVDGGCAGVTITAPPTGGILGVVRVENVILTRLRLEKSGPRDAPAGGDCVTVGQMADRVWVAYNDFGQCGDGAVDVTQSRAGATPTRVTIAFNRFKDHDKTILLGTLECQQPESHPDSCAAPLAAPWSWERGVQVTLQGNVFDGTGQRHPRVKGVTYVHMLDNVVAFRPFVRANGQLGASYGAFVSGGGRLLAENNLFMPLDHRPRTYAVFAAQTAAMRIPEAEGPGAVRIEDAAIVGEAQIDGPEAERVPPPPYDLKPSHRFEPDPAHIAACVAAGTGPAAASRAARCRGGD